MTNFENVISKIYENYDVKEMENSSLVIAKNKIVLPEGVSFKEARGAANASAYTGALFTEKNYVKTESGILLF